MKRERLSVQGWKYADELEFYNADCVRTNLPCRKGVKRSLKMILTIVLVLALMTLATFAAMAIVIMIDKLHVDRRQSGQDQ